MITVLLKGGLGNQMFQYACGRALSLKLNTELSVNPKVAFNPAVPRHYELDHFNINPILNEHKNVGSMVFREKHFHFDPTISTAKDGVMLDGYFQSEKYFKGYEDIIRKDFTLKEPIDNEHIITGHIARCESVSLHIRRGDYITLPGAAKVHGGCCPSEYYSRAIIYIRSKVENPVFFIFSDDIEWVKANMEFPTNTWFVSGNKHLNNPQELIAMSLCKHNIIANSSFSWWAAWLNNNLNKIVVAPVKWFNSNNLDTRDLIPGEWIRI